MASIPALNRDAGDKLQWLAFALNVSLHFTQVPLMRVMLRDADAASRSRYSFWPALFQAAACAQWIGSFRDAAACAGRSRTTLRSSSTPPLSRRGCVSPARRAPSSVTSTLPAGLCSCDLAGAAPRAPRARVRRERWCVGMPLLSSDTEAQCLCRLGHSATVFDDRHGLSRARCAISGSLAFCARAELVAGHGARRNGHRDADATAVHGG